MLQNNDNNYAKQHKWGLMDAYKWDKTVKLSISLIWVSPKSRVIKNDNNYAKIHKWRLMDGYNWDRTLK